MKNPRAEKALLGLLIKTPGEIAKVNAILQPHHFDDKLHAEIYSAINDLWEKNGAVSLTLLASRLPLEDEEGASVSTYLAVLFKNAEAGGSVTAFADEILSEWTRRQLDAVGDWAIKAAASAKISAADALARIEERVRDIARGSDVVREKPMSDIAARVIERAADAYKVESPPGIETGIPALDEIVGRIMPGDLVFIGASQGDSKTSLLTQILEHNAKPKNVDGVEKPGLPCLMFQQEMGDEDVARRLFAARTQISVAKIEEGDFQPAEFDRLCAAQDELAKLNLSIIDQPRMRVSQIRSRALSMKRSRGLAVVGIDHLRLIQADSRTSDIFERIEYVTGSLKSLAKELHAPVIVLAQRTRSSQDRDDPEPRISDLFGGGSIEQDADIVIGLWRRDIWLRQREPHSAASRGEWEVDLAKWRDKVGAVCLKRRRGPAMGKTRLKWNGEATRFEGE
ncbi:MAG TPA: DnaB-like helicase C-terminal domain-containing protein [Xanthobacteraceae bacterium]|nr:DnaB-like helicase C-terminal domain-containing protein [Xanthobacteraceae bacterium]